MKRIVLGLAAIAAMSLVPQTAGAQAAADLTLVHGIPGATVDVAVDGTVVIDDFQPGSLANISSFAGSTLQNVTVTDDATGDVVIGPIAELVIPDSGSHSIVAHLGADGTPALASFQNNTGELPSDQARLTVRHTAAAPAVDVVVGDQRPITNLSNGESAELDLPAGELTDASIAPTGEAPIADLAAIDLAANTNSIVYAIGSVDGDTLDFVVQVVALEVTATTTTTVAGSTTTTVAGSTTTTTVVPTAVNTGSPIDGNSNGLLIAVAIGGLVLAGGAVIARRRI